MPRRIKLTLEYDGTDFKGWQVQSGGEAGDPPLLSGAGATPAVMSQPREGGILSEFEEDECSAPGLPEKKGPVRTVQGVVERALRIVTGKPIRIAGASRTDTGVHAIGQTASLLLPDDAPIPAEELCKALNGNMDRDVTALLAEEMALNFHAQRDSRGKVYSYGIVARRERPALHRRTHWHVRFKLDAEKMRQGAAYLIGTHDFTSFATRLAETQFLRAEEGKTPLETVREIRRIELIEDPAYNGRLLMRIEGSGFLYQMVRTIAGTLVDVGRGFRPPEWVGEALAARDRRKAGPTAPPQGLCLEKVLY